MATHLFSRARAKAVGDALGIDWSDVDPEQFRLGLAVEMEHGAVDPETDVTGDDVIATGKIAWAHLKELPDYYTRLGRMEAPMKGHLVYVRDPYGNVRFITAMTAKMARAVAQREMRLSARRDVEQWVLGRPRNAGWVVAVASTEQWMRGDSGDARQMTGGQWEPVTIDPAEMRIEELGG